MGDAFMASFSSAAKTLVFRQRLETFQGLGSPEVRVERVDVHPQRATSQVVALARDHEWLNVGCWQRTFHGPPKVVSRVGGEVLHLGRPTRRRDCAPGPGGCQRGR
jgi:hypothetical protein